ncbi:alpha-L-fucosidase [Novosphingobium mangrovi (ex Hu et al. 2023)]|uniref:alpha-L-fucosidase n=1 Tax=Novosphingobium mangrovi (ex Hu et al. 2023) TaxID=2930094 RepID=A0ABT0ABJ6_9SPHN|nr:alpha-L-fucosidase [Novosphingobium mangrovi (ex Hu et al. 2023)]MCJ1960572.1 alpha-L-fucosidase [Novosphingobium mangrovi (ex Hu et al. 2023)]
MLKGLHPSRRAFLASALGAGGLAGLAGPAQGQIATKPGPVEPTWNSLVANYRYPDWFRDAKFGIWSHWGPQSVPEQGDWYGRFMYMQGHPMYEHHLRTYGHPADTGMMEVQKRWTADKWDPEGLMDRFVKAGAKYFVSLACHHDNLDCYDSAHHGWNSLRVGPGRDVVGTWEKAARRAGLKFGVSNHTSHAWHWYQPAYAYDPEGPRAGERYDAYHLTKADGAGTWWEGLDPQDLYTGRHMVAPDGIESIAAMNAWHDAHDGEWIESTPPGDTAFARQWLLRQMDLVAKYRPDFCYMDNYELPFGPYGLAAAADYYNRSLEWHGKIDVILTAKQLTPRARFGLVQDVERGFTDHLWDEPWQTDTCLGDWFYNRARFTDKSYVPAAAVVQRLADVISKNGNLLLSVPQRGDGTIDAEEEKILDDLARWFTVNGEAVYGSRPWHVYGEGPTQLQVGMQNEGGFEGFVPGDVRFTTREDALYLFVLATRDAPLQVRALGRRALAQAGKGRIARITQVGGGPVRFRQDADALHLDLAPEDLFVPVLKIEGPGLV